MSNNRAVKSGFAAEAQAKARGKYDEEVAGQVMEWIQKILRDDSVEVDTSPKPQDVYNALKDGYILAKLVNKICGVVIAEKLLKTRQTMPFKIMELIGLCTDAMIKYGVPTAEIFQTVDLMEEQNLWQVVVCLLSFSRKAMSHGFEGCAPKEATANVRNFSDETLKAGNTVIGLQMGYNKGATQSGMNMGNTRHIVD